MFQWLRNLFVTKKEEMHLHVHVHVSGDGVVQQVTTDASRVLPQVKHNVVKNDGPSAQEIAEVMLTGGLDKAVDHGSDGAVAKATSTGISDQLSAFKKMKR